MWRYFLNNFTQQAPAVSAPPVVGVPSAPEKSVYFGLSGLDQSPERSQPDAGTGGRHRLRGISSRLGGEERGEREGDPRM